MEILLISIFSYSIFGKVWLSRTLFRGTLNRKVRSWMRPYSAKGSISRLLDKHFVGSRTILFFSRSTDRWERRKNGKAHNLTKKYPPTSLAHAVFFSKRGTTEVGSWTVIGQIYSRSAIRQGSSVSYWTKHVFSVQSCNMPVPANIINLRRSSESLLPILLLRAI